MTNGWARRQIVIISLLRAWIRLTQRTQIGRESIELTPEISIGIFDPTRSIIDAYRLRDLYGIDQANQALKTWLGQLGNQPSTLLAAAKDFPRAAPVIRTTLQTLL